MSARKLQTEIDKILKKVAEGVEQFDDQYKKIQLSTNLAHKEKQEGELKLQIKKLQRFRDQIKTWLASNEIKDKKILFDNRKLIEQQMERFKACEKEMKTKAFSKEGLSANVKLDPKEQLKIETANFASLMVDELSRQVEMTEAEVEQLQGGAKKSKKGGTGTDKVVQLEELNDRRKWHISRLELILRLMENGNMDPDRIVGLKEDISYFVESNTEEDFEEDEGIYDELKLDEEEEMFGLVDRDDMQSSHDSMSVADTSDIMPPVPPQQQNRTPAKAPSKQASEGDGEKSPTQTKAAKTIAVPQRKPTLDGTATRPTGLTAPTRSASATSAGGSAPISLTSPPAVAPIPRAVPAILPPIRYSAAAASAVGQPSTPAVPAALSVTTPGSSAASTAASVATSIPSSYVPSFASPPVAGSSAPAQQTTSPASLSSPPLTVAAALPALATFPAPAAVPAQPVAQQKALSPDIADTPPGAAESSSAASSDLAPSPTPSHTSPPLSATEPNLSLTFPNSAAPVPNEETSQLSPSQQAASIAPLQALEINSPAQQQQPPIGQSASVPPPQDQIPPPPPIKMSLASPGSVQMPTPQLQQPFSSQGQPSSEARLPSSLADLVTSFESAKQKSLRRDNDLSAIHEILEAGYANIPQPADAERPKYYIPRNVYPTPHYYPQQPSPHLANPALFSKFDVDTLFYIFYYCQGTYMQYLAAQELKKQSWRFHKQYLTWFQRANEPQAITDEYEQGVYLYFDFEGSWAQRRKENFSFFYRHLEE